MGLVLEGQRTGRPNYGWPLENLGLLREDIPPPSQSFLFPLPLDFSTELDSLQLSNPLSSVFYSPCLFFSWLTDHTSLLWLHCPYPQLLPWVTPTTLILLFSLHTLMEEEVDTLMSAADEVLWNSVGFFSSMDELSKRTKILQPPETTTPLQGWF